MKRTGIALQLTVLVILIFSNLHCSKEKASPTPSPGQPPKALKAEIQIKDLYSGAVMANTKVSIGLLKEGIPLAMTDLGKDDWTEISTLSTDQNGKIVLDYPSNGFQLRIQAPGYFDFTYKSAPIPTIDQDVLGMEGRKLRFLQVVKNVAYLEMDAFRKMETTIHLKQVNPVSADPNGLNSYLFTSDLHAVRPTPPNQNITYYSNMPSGIYEMLLAPNKLIDTTFNITVFAGLSNTLSVGTYKVLNTMDYEYSRSIQVAFFADPSSSNNVLVEF